MASHPPGEAKPPPGPPATGDLRGGPLDEFDRRLLRSIVIAFVGGSVAHLLVTHAVPGRAGGNTLFADGMVLVGLGSAWAITRFPWRRFGRDLFAVIYLYAAILIAGLIYSTGGATSPFSGTYLLIAMSAGLYHRTRLALLVAVACAGLGFLPFAYATPGANFLVQQLVLGVGFLAIVWFQWLFLPEILRRARAERGLQDDLRETRRLRDELARANADLARQARTDPLTGLPNRAHFLDHLARTLAARRAGEGDPCAVLFLDLDRFKQVNDTLGHAAGDELLLGVAARLRDCLREGDTLARFGGDEFALLLDNIPDPATAGRFAERLLAALAIPLPVAGRELVVTTSIGIALSATPEDAPADLLRFADVALYRAKAAGRSCYEAFYPGMAAGALSRLELEHDLRGAIERGELVIHFQPSVHLATGRTATIEALVRWRHPVLGLVPPGDFIPLAEETGLIAPIGRWVLAEACRQFVAWRASHPGADAPRLAVNLSAREFRDPALVANVAAVLAATGLAADRLVLELTETSAMADPEAAIATLGALRALGVRLALDDFGTGHSSLAYLQRLPLDTLKIDRSFFRASAQNRAIVGAVADLAHALGLDVTAEGLETDEQVARARAAGCDCGQGHYFTHPLPLEDLAMRWDAGTALMPATGSPARAYAMGMR